MDRRHFLRTLAGASAAVAAPSACSAQSTTKPTISVSTPASAPTNVASAKSVVLGAKRFDKGAGTAIFSGTVPLLPGQLHESGIGSVSLWEGSVERSLAFADLGPRHPDGSLKAIAIHASLELSSGQTKTLTLALDRPRKLAPPTAARIDSAWMRAPRLIGCTDAAHLCASRIAPYPLVPLNHPRLPQAWKTFLSTQFDGTDPDFPAYGNVRPYVQSDTKYPAVYWGGNSNYNFLSALYYRYLVSGDLDKLADAHHCAQYAFGFNVKVQDLTYGNGLVRYASPFGGHRALETFTTNFEYPSTLPQPLGTTEWNSGFHADMYVCYCLSGWPQAAGTLIPYGIRNLVGSWGGGKNFGNPTGSYDASGYGGRFDFRLSREPEIYFAMLNLPMDLRWDMYYTVVAPSIRSNREKYLEYLQAKCFDSFESWSKRFPQGHYLHGIWGMAPSFAGAFGSGPGTYPNFQGITFFNTVLLLYLNLIKDPRVPDQMVKYARLMAAQTRGPVKAWKSGLPLYRMPYMMTDGAKMNPAAATSFYTTAMLVPLWVYAWRVTGDQHMLVLADAHATNKAWVYDTNLGSAGVGWKQMGEVYHMAFPAAAWRAGVPFDGWTVA